MSYLEHFGNHANINSALLLLFGSIKESNSSYHNRRYRSVVCPSVCPSTTLVHHAKVVGRNEMPFGRDTHVVPSSTVLDRGPGLPMGRAALAGWNSLFAAMLHIAKLL